MTRDWDAVVVGAGPAGLMAAGEIARTGYRVLVVEAKPSIARKFLMAGKSGLNLTKDEPLPQLLSNFGEAQSWLKPMLSAFHAQDVQDWATGLGRELFVGSTGRVFPKEMKASPLLRAWLSELDDLGVERRTRWRWLGWAEDGGLSFDTPEGTVQISARATVLALGGASWPRLGSDGAWADTLLALGVSLAPFKPANVGVLVPWSKHMESHFGRPIKGVQWIAGKTKSRGEAVVSQSGLEGGGIYSVSAAVREGADLTVDLLPDLSLEEVVRRLLRPRGKASLSSHLRKTLKLGPERLALLQEFGRPLPTDVAALATTIKSLPIRTAGLRPLAEAISTAGGIRQENFDERLMLKRLPGTFCAGEMLDWEAPTGGYLLTACFATGRWAGRHAAAYLASAATR